MLARRTANALLPCMRRLWLPPYTPVERAADEWLVLVEEVRQGVKWPMLV